MAEIINLRRARKQRDRDKRAEQAEVNRALFGQTPGERRQREEEARRLAQRLDQHRLDQPTDDT